MLSTAPRSPTGRKIGDVAERILRLDTFERWRPPTQIDFESIVGKESWDHYWSLCDAVNQELREAQAVADQVRATIIERLDSARSPHSRAPESGL